MATGTVKWFNPTKGYGFIVPDEGDNDVFVHITAVEQAGMGTLNEGQRISFEVRNEPRGLKAVDLAAAEGGDGPAEEKAPAAAEEEAPAAEEEEAPAAAEEEEAPAPAEEEAPPPEENEAPPPEESEGGGD